jgi:hypothetical protein
MANGGQAEWIVRAFRTPHKFWAYRLRQGLALFWKESALFLSTNLG